jgi:hypothetical protein
MSQSSDPVIEARTVRYDLARLRLGQLLIPATMVASVVARHFSNPATWLLAFAMLAVSLATVIRARKAYGIQSLRIGRKKLRIGDTGFEIEQAFGPRWDFRAATARFRTSDVTWRLTATSGQGDALRLALSRLFGEPPAWVHRGSPRARWATLGVGVTGLACVSIGLLRDVQGLFVLGFLPMFIGLIGAAALFQKVPASDGRQAPR